MKATVFLLVLFFILIARRRLREKYTQPNTNYFRVADGDRVCGDLKYTRGPDLEKCKSMCDATNNCIGISWHPHRHCWLKGSNGTSHCRNPLSMGHHRNGYQFYYKQVPGYYVEGEGDRPGGDIRGIPNVGVKQCGDECKKHGDCIGFSYNSAARYCIPKRQKGIWGHFAHNGWQFYNRTDRGGQPGETAHFQKWTPANDWGGGNTVYLDRHQIDCETGALRSFHLYRPRHNQLAYEYVCQKDWDAKGRIARNTGWNQESWRSIYLDRHNVECGAHPIRDFRLIRNGKGRFMYVYGCSDKKHSGKCYGKSTPWNTEGNHRNIYLDRHHPNCGNDVMSRFKLQRRGGKHRKFRYDYTCCKK